MNFNTYSLYCPSLKYHFSSILRSFLGNQMAVNFCRKSTPQSPTITSKYTVCRNFQSSSLHTCFCPRLSPPFSLLWYSQHVDLSGPRTFTRKWSWFFQPVWQTDITCCSPSTTSAVNKNKTRAAAVRHSSDTPWDFWLSFLVILLNLGV